MLDKFQVILLITEVRNEEFKKSNRNLEPFGTVEKTICVIRDVYAWPYMILGYIGGATNKFPVAVDDRSRIGTVLTSVFLVLWNFGVVFGFEIHPCSSKNT